MALRRWYHTKPDTMASNMVDVVVVVVVVVFVGSVAGYLDSRSQRNRLGREDRHSNLRAFFLFGCDLRAHRLGGRAILVAEYCY